MTNTSYILKVCNENFDQQAETYSKFRWPSLGLVECQRFEGDGLRGFLNGCGDGSMVNWSHNAQWLIVAVPTETIIPLKGDVKFPRGEVVFSSADRLATIAELERLDPRLHYLPLIGAIRTDIKEKSLVVAGFNGSATAGVRGSAEAGDCGIAVTGAEGIAKVGNHGCATAGRGGTAIAGHYGTATVGEGGTAIVGKGGTANIGLNGKAQAGEGGILLFHYYENGKLDVERFIVDGEIIQENTLYDRITLHNRISELADLSAAKAFGESMKADFAARKLEADIITENLRWHSNLLALGYASDVISIRSELRYANDDSPQLWAIVVLSDAVAELPREQRLQVLDKLEPAVKSIMRASDLSSTVDHCFVSFRTKADEAEQERRNRM